MKKKILVVAAHPDDEIIGCGGTLLKHIYNKDDVFVVYASDGESSRVNGKNKILKRKKQAKDVAKIAKIKKIFFLDYPDNQMDKINLLKISKSISLIVDKIKPDIIYTHHYNDLNIDHRITFEATMVACRPIKKKNVTEIYSFEILSSSEWYGRKDLGTGVLHNKTNGGDGTMLKGKANGMYGKTHSPESIAKIKQAREKQKQITDVLVSNALN